MVAQQAHLDALFHRSPEQIKALRSNHLPQELAQNLVGPLGPPKDAHFPLLFLLMAMSLGLAIGLVSYSLLLFYIGLGLSQTILVYALVIDSRHRKQQRQKAEMVWLRNLWGEVQTERHWTFSYRDLCFISSKLTFEHHSTPTSDYKKEVNLGPGMGEKFIIGPAKAYVAMVPYFRNKLVEYVPVLLYLELLEGAKIVEKAMENPPPKAPWL